MTRATCASFLLGGAALLLIASPGRVLAGEAPCTPADRPPCPEATAPAPCIPQEAPCLG